MGRTCHITSSVPLLLFLLPFSCHVAVDEHQQFWRDRHSPGLLRASFLPVGEEKWVVNVLFGMVNQVLKEWWRKAGRSGLRGV